MAEMRVLVIGSGGREHALAWALRRDGAEVVCAPGNPGMAELGAIWQQAATDAAGLAERARRERIDLAVVGPEVALYAGVADQLRKAGIPTVGPSREQARLEQSKAFAKQRMADLGVPTAAFAVAHTLREVDEALERIEQPVIKADGPYLGKGVVVPDSPEEARAAAERFLKDGPVVLEQRLSGHETSLLALCGGGIAILPAARDYKRIGDGDRGPNTGGMGAVAPLPLPEAQMQALSARAIEPLVRATSYGGVLYAGLMHTEAGVQVLEYNVRFGDPECQVLMPILTGWPQRLLATAEGRLVEEMPKPGMCAVAVVLAAEGYPESPVSGDTVEGIDAARSLPGVEVLIAGCRLQSGRLVTSGGRVLNVVGVAATVEEARRRAYAGAERIHFRGMQMRRDIAAQA